MAASFDKSQVLDELTTVEALAAFDIKVRRAGREWRSDECPRCGEGAKGRSKFSTDGRKFLCFSCGFKGDVLTLVGELAGIDPRHNFPAVVAAAGELAGLSPTSSSTEEERVRRKAERERRRTEEERLAAEARREAEARAPAVWAGLASSSEQGMEYLKTRRLEAAIADVRFSTSAICVPLWSLDGVIMNVVARRFADGPGPKVKGLTDCSTFGCFGDPTRLASTSGPIVIVEGVCDWLSGRVLWPERLVLGAHGAGRLPDIALFVGTRAASAQRGLLFVPHRDDTGIRQVDKAIDMAFEAGMPSEDVEVLDVGAPHNDLNDLVRGGGR